MSIVTKTGDHGTTGLMYNRRVPKFHPRIQACGAVDELNSALGMARSTTAHAEKRLRMETVQKELVGLMGELATLPEDWEKYKKDGYAQLSGEMTSRLEAWIKELEAKNISFNGWATPGANLHSGSLDMARSICRRAERHVCELQETAGLNNPEPLIYLNRLSDLLWLMARDAEAEK